MKYNLSKIMFKAWKVYRKTKNIRFAEALHRAWYLQRQKKSMQRESKMRNMQQESQRKPIPLLSGKSLL